MIEQHATPQARHPRRIKWQRRLAADQIPRPRPSRWQRRLAADQLAGHQRHRPAASAIAALTAALLLTCTASARAQAFPDSVAEFTPGHNAGFGQQFFPDNVLGPPEGTLNPQVPNDTPEDILSLGTGGSITLEFTTHRIIDLPGPDFTVFENPVQPINHPEQSFVDAGIVSVSPDGNTWYTFPVDMVSSRPQDLRLKSNYIGFAGVQPTYSSTTNGISPFDPAVSGGDQFDLATVSLPAVRFIRITDAGDARHMPTLDKDGDVVYDYGNLIDPDPARTNLGIAAGFDLDAVAALHTEPYDPSSVPDWAIYD